MPTIKLSILRILVGHANASTPTALRPWVHPPTFGESSGAYSTLSRLSDAGITPEELDKLGLGIQGESLNRLRETQGKGDTPPKLDNAEARRATYRAAGHLRMVNYAVNPTTCPTGLRPASIPATARADQLSAWHTALTTLAANATGDMVELPPLVTGDGSSVGAAPRSPSAPRASGPFGRFQAIRAILGSAVTDMLASLDGADAPELVASPRSAFAAWAMSFPQAELDSVTADAFDATTVRQGSSVVPLDGSPVLKAIGFVLKASKVEHPESFTVLGIAEGIATLSAGSPTARPLTAPVAQLRRYVAPRPVAPTTAAPWAPTVDGLAMFNGEEVLVTALGTDGDATVLDANGEEQTVAIEFLTTV